MERLFSRGRQWDRRALWILAKQFAKQEGNDGTILLHFFITFGESQTNREGMMDGKMTLLVGGHQDCGPRQIHQEGQDREDIRYGSRMITFLTSQFKHVMKGILTRTRLLGVGKSASLRTFESFCYFIAKAKSLKDVTKIERFRFYQRRHTNE